MCVYERERESTRVRREKERGPRSGPPSGGSITGGPQF